MIKRIYKKHRLYPTNELYIDTEQLNIRHIFASRLTLKLATDGIHEDENTNRQVTRTSINRIVIIPKCNKQLGQRNYKQIGLNIINDFTKNLRYKVYNFENKYYYKLKYEVDKWLSNKKKINKKKFI